MKQKIFEFSKNGNVYKVFVAYKYQRHTYFRYKEEGFFVTTPYMTSERMIMSGIEKYFDRLLKQFNKTITHYSFEEDYLFLLGNKCSLKELNIYDEGELRAFLEKTALETLKNEVRKYEEIMGIKTPYKIKVKNTARQFGSNSKRTHTLSFQISLIHYSLEIIDTVVVHELAHEFERNHQQGFYNIVYKYSPNYKQLQRKLKKGVHL